METTTRPAAATAASLPGASFQRTRRRATQDPFPASGLLRPSPDEGDLSTLQKQAKELLRKRQATYSQVASLGSHVGVHAAPGEAFDSTTPFEQALQSWTRERGEAPPGPLSSMAPASTPSQASVFSGHRRVYGGKDGHGFSPSAMLERQQFESSHSSESSSDPRASLAVQPTSTASSRQHHGREASTFQSNNVADGHPQVKDLLDVVGGMILMSGRGSATVPSTA